MTAWNIKCAGWAKGLVESADAAVGFDPVIGQETQFLLRQIERRIGAGVGRAGRAAVAAAAAGMTAAAHISATAGMAAAAAAETDAGVVGIDGDVLVHIDRQILIYVGGIVDVVGDFDIAGIVDVGNAGDG